VSSIGISRAMCKSSPRSRQTTMPAPHHSVFYRPDPLPAAQPTASKHWRQICTAAVKHERVLNLLVFADTCGILWAYCSWWMTDWSLVVIVTCRHGVGSRQEAAGADSDVPCPLGPRVLRCEAHTDDDVHASSAEHHQRSSGDAVAATVVIVWLQSDPGYSLWRPQLTAGVRYDLPHIAHLFLSLVVPSVLWCCWLGGRKGIRPVVGCWRGYLSAARCRLATATHCLLLQWNPDWFYFSDTGSPR